MTILSIIIDSCNEAVSVRSTDIENHSITFGYRDLKSMKVEIRDDECFQQRSDGTNSALYAS